MWYLFSSPYQLYSCYTCKKDRFFFKYFYQYCLLSTISSILSIGGKLKELAEGLE